MQRIYSSVLFLFIFCFGANAQVGINIMIPDSSAVLQLVAPNSNKGLGLTQLNNTQMNSVWQPLNGLTLFNTTDSFVTYWNGMCWLRAYQHECNECEFTMSLDHNTDTIDRTYVDSAFATLTITRTSSTDTTQVSYMGVAPAGVNIHLNGNTSIGASGTVQVVVSANIWADGGIVPVVVMAICGDSYHLLTYNVYIKPCIDIDIPMDDHNYDLQARNSGVLPAGSRECVIVNVYPGVEVSSQAATDASYTSGNLNPLSIVGIKNQGWIYGHGGDGGSFAGTVTGGSNGFPGGDAIHLTTRTVIQNYGGIYGGGGGGASIGIVYPYSTPSICIPFIGCTGGINFIFGIGIGGGGGSASGLGGSAPTGSTVIGAIYAGQNATDGHNSVPGNGNGIAVPISLDYSGVGITLTPTGGGGNGGAFGQPGTTGNLGLCIALDIPIVGSINLTCQNIANPGSGGQPGLAVKRNGNQLTGLADGTYNNNQVKGQVAP